MYTFILPLSDFGTHFNKYLDLDKYPLYLTSPLIDHNSIIHKNLNPSLIHYKTVFIVHLRIINMNYREAEKLLDSSYSKLRSQHSDRGHHYIRTHWERYVNLLTMMPAINSKTRVLEIGASILSAHLHLTCHCPTTVIYHEKEPEWGKRFSELHITSFAADLMRDKLPIQDNSFDLILFNEVMEHFPLHPAFFVRQLIRKLSDKGELFFSVPNFATSEKRLQLLCGKNPQDNMDKRFIYYAHHREPVMKECIELIEKFGGKIIENRWFEGDGDPDRLATIKRLLFHLYRKRIHCLVHFLVPSTRRYILIRAIKNNQFYDTPQNCIPPISLTREFGV